MKTLTAVLGLVLSLSGSWVGAQQRSAGAVSVHIQAQPMQQALDEFARQTGLQLVFATEEVARGMTAPAVSGSYAPKVALDILLADSGLQYEFINAKTVAIEAVKGGEGLPAAGVGNGTEGVRVAQAGAGASTAEEGGGSQQEESQEAEVGDSEELEEIVVTAQKRKERLIDTPQSVTVLSPDALAKAGAVQFRDYANTVPGLTFTTLGAGNTQVTLRGVTTGWDISPTVGVYVDEVPYGSSSAFSSGAQLALDVGLFDMDRIEVLRGPQGTIYGASTMGGLLKYVTRQPDMTRFGADLRTGVSSTRQGGVSYFGNASINAPIVADKVALRATGFYSRDGGYIDNLTLYEKDVNRSAVYGGRSDLLLAPNDALSIRITAFLQNIARDGVAEANYTFAGEPIDGTLDQRRLFPEPFDQRFRLISATLTYDLEPASLTSISSYQTARTQLFTDYSGALVPVLTQFGFPIGAVGNPVNAHTDKFIQEVRLASAEKGTLEWLIGAFYTRETSGVEQEMVGYDLAGQPSSIELFTFSAPSRFEEYAAFGDLTWHISDKFDVTGGIRYAHNRQEYEQTVSGLFCCSTPRRISSDEVPTYLANARYHFNEHATGYLRYATGYRPGGPNYVIDDPNTGLPVGSPTYEADRLKSYEVGFKAETVDRRFGLDLSGYYIDWSNLQIRVQQGAVAGIGNAPGASIRGAELALSAHPTTALTVSSALAYQHAKLSEAVLDQGAAKGERLPNVPRFTAALKADYEFPVGSWSPTIGATLRYVDEREASFNNNLGFLQYHLPAYSTVDLRGGFTLRAIDAQIYLVNLFDKRGQLSAANYRGSAMPAILQPRTVGITLATRF